MPGSRTQGFGFWVQDPTVAFSLAFFQAAGRPAIQTPKNSRIIQAYPPQAPSVYSHHIEPQLLDVVKRDRFVAPFPLRADDLLAMSVVMPVIHSLPDGTEYHPHPVSYPLIHFRIVPPADK
jgi:hypothetical protein